jgi:hypothetical protein
MMGKKKSKIKKAFKFWEKKIVLSMWKLTLGYNMLFKNTFDI